MKVKSSVLNKLRTGTVLDLTQEEKAWVIERIEQAEIIKSHAPEGRNYTNADYIKLLQLNELYKKKVIELEKLVTCPDCQKKLDWCECEEILD